MEKPNGKIKHRNTILAHKIRNILISALGSKCVKCGSTEELEFDHIEPRNWIAASKSSLHRMNIYAREIKQGKIQLLCATCNAKRGYPKQEQIEEQF